MHQTLEGVNGFHSLPNNNKNCPLTYYIFPNGCEFIVFVGKISGALKIYKSLIVFMCFSKFKRTIGWVLIFGYLKTV